MARKAGPVKTARRRPPAGRELILLRHAKSAWDTDAPTDFQRPLSPRGKRAARRVGERLRGSRLVPDLVVSSPAKRAKQTARRVLRGLGLDEDEVRWVEALYAAGLEEHLRVLADLPRSARRVLLVGHNPTLEGLLRHLARGPVPESADGKILPTAALARLRMPADWRRLRAGCARLVAITRTP